MLPTSSVMIIAAANDSDGTIVSFVWTKISGAGSQTLSNATQPSTTISGFAAAGTYVFRLTAIDDDGASSMDDVSVVVYPVPVASPTPSPSPSISVPVAEGLPPPTTIVPCRLQSWSRNNPGGGFNNYDTVLYVPCDYYSDPKKRYPLVISNHGRGGSTFDTATHTVVGGKNFEGFIRQLADGKAAQATYGAIVLAPDLHRVGDGTDFFPSDSATHHEARLILDAIKFLKVDPKRITVTGLSYGGSMTIGIMDLYQGLIAGALPYAMQPPNKGGITAENTCRWVKFSLWAAGRGDDGVFNIYEWGKNFAGGFKYTIERCPGYVTGEYFRLTDTGTGGTLAGISSTHFPKCKNG